MTNGIDCATPLTAKTAQAIAAAGYGWVGRYLVPDTYYKHLSRAEAEAITAAGLQIISVFETTNSRPAGGTANGKADGAAALACARDVGQPVGSAIYFAVDYQAMPEDYDAIEAYLRAAGAQIPGYEVGVYGSYVVVEEMIRRGAAKHGWQTYAWSRGQRSTHANLYQYNNGQKVGGVLVDLNMSYGCEGWWNLNPVPAADPQLEEKEDDALQLSNYQWGTVEAKINTLLDSGKIKDTQWLEKAKARTLTVSDLLWLTFTIA